jgi:hypothetical protein
LDGFPNYCEVSGYNDDKDRNNYDLCISNIVYFHSWEYDDAFIVISLEEHNEDDEFLSDNEKDIVDDVAYIL